MTIKVNIVFVDPRGLKNAELRGLEVPYDKITLGDLTDKIAETEAHLSRIMGLVVKIETGAE